MIKALNLPPGGVTPEAIEFARNSGTGTIILWAPGMAHYQERSAYDQLDGQIRLAHSAGRQVIICIPTDGGPRRLPPILETWTRYVWDVMVHYRVVAWAFILMNEPNAAFANHPAPAQMTATMIRRGAWVAQQLGVRRVLAPGTLNSVGFTERVLRNLNGFLPRWRHWKPPAGVWVGWAHHPYADVKAGSIQDTAGVLALLKKYWYDGPRLWLTEGGYVYDVHQTPNPDYVADPSTWQYNLPLIAQEKRQRSNVWGHYEWSKQHGVQLWANFEYQDSLWGGWASGFKAHDGVPHLLYADWSRL